MDGHVWWDTRVIDIQSPVCSSSLCWYKRFKRLFYPPAHYRKRECTSNTAVILSLEIIASLSFDVGGLIYCYWRSTHAAYQGTPSNLLICPMNKSTIKIYICGGTEIKFNPLGILPNHFHMDVLILLCQREYDIMQVSRKFILEFLILWVLYCDWGINY